MVAILVWCKWGLCHHYIGLRDYMLLPIQLFWYIIHFSIFISSKVVRHNLIIGKSCGGHLVFMQIRPVIIFSPTKKSQSFFIRCPCAKFRGFISIFTPWWKSQWTKHDDFIWRPFCISISNLWTATFRSLLVCSIQHDPLGLGKLLVKKSNTKTVEKGHSFRNN